MGKVLKFEGSDLHDVAYVEVLDPLCLVQEAKNMP